MNLLISGVCGFVGSTLARELAGHGHRICGFDNFIRPGSETSREPLKRLGVTPVHADVRAASDLDALPPADWVIDAAANPSVLAGVDGRTSSRQLVEHNLAGTVNLLEYAKRHRAGLILLSTSRVYSIAALAALELRVERDAFRPASATLAAGIPESFPTTAPVSLYGATKLASEALALEYGESFDLPVFVNRCGVLAGAGQFGRADQGIFAFWLNSHLRRRPLRYLGFGGHGHQVRDVLHPRDLVPLLEKQFAAPRLPAADRLVNVSGGAASATSLRQLTAWCDARFGAHPVVANASPRQFDLPWVVLDHARATALWDWRPRISRDAILDEIAAHAEAHPDWLDLSAPL
ncbi:MAG TPA: NAD-dependent epimerase/dehydratase family protein [Opitutus sp.]|nr:NAD-dependent epimerase/dehydratase family protein [Opitutus sp.]